MDYAAIVVLEILYMIAFLALISAGLAVVFGMMRVINLAHGEFVMLGGYATIAAAKAGINIYFAMPIPGYRIGHYQMGGYNLFVIAVAVILMCAMWFVLRYTRVGLIARGTMQGRDVVASLGYNPSTIFMLTFTVGAALSGLAGGVMAPLTGLLPSIGGAYIAKAFITVITGGAAVIAGTLSTAGLFGTVDQLVSFASTPVLGEIAMLALALVLLRLMPQGVTGQFFRNST
jgi:urea transport system permease protein